MLVTNHARLPRRPGFTLIELLSVIAIIAVLLAIAVGAYFRVRVAQEEKATETVLSKLQSQFDQQWRSVLDNARDEAGPNAAQSTRIPTGVKTLADMDNRRIRVIWTKLRLKQEFPQTFWDALKWAPAVGMEAKYLKELQGVVPRDPATMTPVEQAYESAALLYLSMAKTRRGNAGFNPTEHLGPHAVGKASIQVTTSPVTFRDFDVFIDTWGQPICFVRWPTKGAWSDINQPPHQARNAQGQPVDPQDPEKSLLDASWYSNATLRAQFLVNVGYDPTNPPLNLSPVLFSFGRDQLPGVDGDFNRLSGDEDDNIYGYRVKVGRGNN